MKVKLLKKLRKRFEWKWDEYSATFDVVDHKTKQVACHSGSQSLVEFIWYAYRGSTLTQRFDKRNRRVRYYRELKRMRE